jgi:hypothetical protein
MIRVPAFGEGSAFAVLKAKLLLGKLADCAYYKI